jgi:site-specific DNA-methyltransferase (adenine-specific)
MNDIPASSIDLILCDLPYQTTNCEWDIKIPFDVLWKHYNRVKKINTPIVLFSHQPFTSGLITSNLKQYRYNWYWIKNNVTGFCFAKNQPMRRVEDICVFYDRSPVYNLNLHKSTAKKSRRNAEDSVYKLKTLAYRTRYQQENCGYPDNVLYFDGDNLGSERYHPTQKPIKLLEYLIRTYSNIGDTVLDNTMGSGSTGVAATNTGRHFIGIEKEKKYFNVAEKRIREAEQLSASNLFDVVTLEGSIKAPPPCQGNKSGRFF